MAGWELKPHIHRVCKFVVGGLVIFEINSKAYQDNCKIICLTFPGWAWERVEVPVLLFMSYIYSYGN